MALSKIYEPAPVTEYTPTESRFTPENEIEDQQNYTSFEIPVQQMEDAIVESIYVQANSQVKSAQ